MPKKSLGYFDVFGLNVSCYFEFLFVFLFPTVSIHTKPLVGDEHPYKRNDVTE